MPTRLRSLLFTLLVGCGLLNGGETERASQTIGVLWYSPSGMAERVYEGCRDMLNNVAPQIRIELRPNLENEEEAFQLYAAWQDRMDAVVFLRSHGATYMGLHPPRIPGFIGAANDPVALGIMTDRLHPQGNVTGVTYFVPLDVQIDLFRKLLPTMKSLCLLVMQGHPSSPLEQEGTRAVCAANGIVYREALCSDPDDLREAVLRLRDQVDCFVLGNQNLLIDNGRIVADHSGTKPIFSYTQKPIEDGHAVAGLVADDHKLGLLLGKAIHEVLVLNKPVAEVPVRVDPEPKIYISLGKMRRWKLTPPLSLLRVATRVP